jgi:hypothetical protein
VDAQRADRIADGVAEEGVLVLGGLDRLALGGIGRRQHQRAVQRQRQRRGEEEADRQHVRRVVVEVQILVAGVRHPIEMAHDAVGEAVAPGAHQHRADHHQRDIGENRDAEGEGHVQPHAELAADLHLAQRPGDERADRADRDELPQAAFLQRREAQAVAEVRRRDADLPEIPGRPDRRAPDDQRVPRTAKNDRRDAEEADIERADPEIEQIAADQGAAADAVFFSKLSIAIVGVLPSNGGFQLWPAADGPGPGGARPPAFRAARYFRRCRQWCHLRRGAVMRAVQPVEPVGAEQDEVDQHQ